MAIFLKIIYESIAQAFQSLKGNKMRTFLSLLGITIGIFCIITVKSAVDSLQDNIVEGFNELGSDVLYVDVMPWSEDPNHNYWKYAKRPPPSYEDYEVIKRKAKLADNTAYTVFTGGRTLKYRSSSVDNAFIMGSTYEYKDIQNLKIEKGRNLTPMEYERAANKIVLGHVVSDELFGNKEPIGKEVRLFGQKFQVIGMLEAEGENIFNFLNFDEVIWMGFNTMKKFVNTNENSSVGKMLNVKAIEGYELADLKDEVTGILRSHRRLKPSEDSNFAVNELSMLSDVLDSFFGVLHIAGIIIGGFALIVGMFSVANIMFVSVKERTNIIGIKKALGARRAIIMLEFLIEAVILCLLGGIVGLILVFGVLQIISMFIPFSMYVSALNMAVGVAVSVIVGIISGVIPAFMASRMDPVEAIRA